MDGAVEGEGWTTEMFIHVIALSYHVTEDIRDCFQGYRRGVAHPTLVIYILELKDHLSNTNFIRKY